MKSLLFLSLFFLCSFSFAQSDKEVQTAIESLRIAMIDPSTEVLTQLTASNLSYGHSSGKIENREEFIEALVSGTSDFKTIILTDQTISFSGKKTAIVRHKLSGETLDGGRSNTVNLGVLLVWVKEKGDWKLAARQAFRL
ncbi:hypothetical protein P872_18725 [Rhodonellum psychrophilum GCM71 = DSM 17998]|uniref:DUF4440 domain-containing protein n=2 Tax=Rhodonellum TaxID=336827 RepID=U5BP56_9BACT|nr:MULTISPECIES: nuclear transport factor 2 family protein [Rhodonellum]ERM82325.1 hypothetical protein P872_18725 [Rhodonellum psychrophilum GCM71 = DSM 17998]SDZ48759.1 protein of unknown function [Rhodonellum ikkaensis]